MGYKIAFLFAACAVIGLSLATQDRVRRQIEVGDYEDENSGTAPNWISCDIVTDNILSCYDCNTRLICKPNWGMGFMKPCRNPLKPYCNGGLCSATKDPSCDDE